MGTSSLVDPLPNHMLAAPSDHEFNQIALVPLPLRFPLPTELGARNETIESNHFPATQLAAIGSIDQGGISGGRSA